MIRLVTLALLFVASVAAAQLRPIADPINVPELVVQGPQPPADAIFTWSADGKLLASVSPATDLLQLWDTRTGNLIHVLDVGKLPTGNIYSADFSISPDKRYVRLRVEDGVRACVTIVADLGMIVPDLERPETPFTSTCVHYSPPRPPGPGGRRVVATAAGETIVAPGQPPVRLAGGRARSLVAVAVTASGTRAVLLEKRARLMGDTTRKSIAEAWQLDSGMRLSRRRIPGGYDRVEWLDENRFVVTAEASHGGTPTPTRIIDALSGRDVERASFRCATTLYTPAGAMIAGRASGCFELDEVSRGLATAGLWVRPPNGAWRPVRAAGLGAPIVEAVAAAGDGRTAAFLTRRTIGYDHPDAPDRKLLTQQTRAVVIEGDLLGGAAQARTLPIRWLSDNERASQIRFTPDRTRIVINTDARLIVIRLADGNQTSLPRPPDSDTVLLATGDDAAMTVRYHDTLANGIDFDGRHAGLMTADHPIINAGFLANGMRWTAASDGSIRYFSLGWGDTITLHNLGDAGYVASDLYGRYDSVLGPDSNAFRWWFPDEPLRSLGGQVFMRDYLEPQLLAKTLACTAAGTCATALPAPPPVSDLDCTLPLVRIARVRSGPTRDTAIVDVEAHEVAAPAAVGIPHPGLYGASAVARGPTVSGLYNLRLFRAGKLVGQWPRAPSDTAVLDKESWRRANALSPGSDGWFRRSFTVRLPTGFGARRTEFQAYAFNRDRVKSDTARATYTRPLVWPATPVAYVVTIGINDYADDRFHLDYAVADADLLATRLSTIPGYRVHRLSLRADARRRQATLASIGDALALLAPGNHAAARARLGALGVDTSDFAPATPDDLVIVTFAGHGWADPHGTFYLVPADESWPENADRPDLGRLISAAQLSDWLRPVDAGDAAIIIDACNSAAVVADGGFKPGPLGDRGLGQLAYDKGILVLAASQADQKAHEDARLGHGFLTAALGNEGLNAAGFGRADLNGDGRITLDEWLRYAVDRLPTLATSGRGRNFAAVADSASTEAASAPQVPALFDFASGPSPVELAREPLSAQAARFGRWLADGLGFATNAMREAGAVAFSTVVGGTAVALFTVAMTSIWAMIGVGLLLVVVAVCALIVMWRLARHLVARSTFHRVTETVEGRRT